MLAAALARQCGCPLTVLHAFIVPSWHDADGSYWRRQTRKEAADQLSKFVDRHLGNSIEIQQRLGVGRAWEIIGKAASRGDAGLIVMGTSGRTGVRGLVIGYTAERVLRSCDRSILAVKPTKFISPVPVDG